MSLRDLTNRFVLLGATWLIAFAPAIGAEATNSSPIDLPSALRLAGAQNLDVQLAREQVVEARANHEQALAQFFPWLATGVSYRRHDDKIQDVEGNIIDVHKYSYAPGATISAQVDVGEALYQSLAAKQTARAATHGLEAQRQDAVLAAATGYFELVLAQASAGIAAQSVKISSDYEAQLGHAVSAGLAFKGDQLRVQVQLQRGRLALRESLERQRIAAARLAEVLRLDPSVELAPQENDLAPIALFGTNAAMSPLVRQALATREELKQNHALVAAARETRNGFSVGPMIPSVGAQAFFGGLGGGRRGVADSFGGQEDYLVGLSWRFGPGGLFDWTRVRAADSRVKQAEIGNQKLEDEITRQVVEAFTHWQAAADRVEMARLALDAAEQGLRLARQRQEFAVGIVLENIQAEQDLTRARLDYVKAISDFNSAQYSLRKAIGEL